MAQTDRPLVDAMRAIYGLRTYTAFDISELRPPALDSTDVARGPHAIHIIVNSARVLLLGEVRTTGDRQLANGSIRSLPGVLGVVNQLRVNTR